MGCSTGSLRTFRGISIETNFGQKPATKEDRKPVQVLICSCTSQIFPKDVHVLNNPPVPHTVTAIPSVRQLRSLLTNYLPVPPIFLSPRNNTALQTFNNGYSHLKKSNLPSRAEKYIRNPLKLIELANRNKVHAQQILSVRFVFNLTCVILWVLLRKFLELFGIRISAFALMGDMQNPGL